eukprot:1597529-Prymnesium_polylepis.1
MASSCGATPRSSPRAGGSPNAKMAAGLPSAPAGTARQHQKQHGGSSATGVAPRSPPGALPMAEAQLLPPVSSVSPAAAPPRLRPPSSSSGCAALLGGGGTPEQGSAGGGSPLGTPPLRRPGAAVKVAEQSVLALEHAQAAISHRLTLTNTSPLATTSPASRRRSRAAAGGASDTQGDGAPSKRRADVRDVRSGAELVRRMNDMAMRWGEEMLAGEQQPSVRALRQRRSSIALAIVDPAHRTALEQAAAGAADAEHAAGKKKHEKKARRASVA